MVSKWNSLRIRVKMKSLTPRENHLSTKTQMRSSCKPRSKRPEERNATKKTPFPLTVANAGNSRSRGSHTEVSVHSRVVQPLRRWENHVFFGGMGSLAGWKGIGCWWSILRMLLGGFLRWREPGKPLSQKKADSTRQGEDCFLRSREREEETAGLASLLRLLQRSVI